MMWHEIHKLNYVAQNSMTGLRVPQQIVYYFDHRYLQLESSIIVHIIIILVSRLANQTAFPFYLWRRKGPQLQEICLKRFGKQKELSNLMIILR